MARLASVSPITVSRALRKPDMVSPALRKRIEAAAAKLAYVPDLAASRLASPRSYTVGVIVPTLYNVIFAEYLQALHEVLLAANFQVVVVNSRYSEHEEEAAIRTLLGQRVEAIIMVGVAHTPMTRRLLMGSKIPVVETFELTVDPVGINIGLSQRAAGRDATRFLLGLGFRNIAFMVGHLDVRAAARLEGYREALQEADLYSEDLIVHMPRQSCIVLGSVITNEMFQRKAVPEAVYCIDDNVALGALQECRRLGIRVPQDISILGFHDLEFAACASPSLSSVFTHRYEIGRLAAMAAIEAMSGRAATMPQTTDVGYQIIPRESTAKPS